ncbi:MAG TPA: arginine--tRNA ligase [Woeseiaceae bacterium]|nr:arginine--tRNA ligase [Woeseiaceae bacterium]
MKAKLEKLVADAVASDPALAAAAAGLDVAVSIERTRDAAHGDFATNVAMRLAKPARRNPREIAGRVIAALADDAAVASVEIAGPGFINFRLSPAAYHAEVAAILAAGAEYGRHPARSGPKVLLEFVSANPTGPLHVGHGRLAAYGATVGNLLEAAGYPVTREYYVNDAGRQMDILGASVWLRRLERNGIEIPFPRAGYRGDYIREIAASIDTGGLAEPSREDVLAGLPEDGPKDAPGDTADARTANRARREAYVEAVIEQAKRLLGEDGFDRVRQQSLESILDDIRDDLAEFGVVYDNWYSEQSLTKSDRIDAALDVLRERGILYEKDGATWFPATRYGDEKDRVVVRENGVKTYFASDIAYHFDKRQRGFEYLVDILGADHHGYVTRVRAGLEAMGYEGSSLEVQLVQFVTLYRGGEKMQMSTRSGEFDTLRQLRAEVGNDAARLFYVLRSNDQHLDFDLDVAKSQSNDNPVYYIQYAHARIASVFRQLGEKGHAFDAAAGLANLGAVTEPQAKPLLTSLSRYPEVLELAANNRAPQHLVHYLRELANDFHSWYNAEVFLVDDATLRNARLALCRATQVVVANGLGILGVSAPESM